MTSVIRRSAHRLSVVGQCVLIVLGLAWALFERPAPFVNVRWRDGLSAEDRKAIEARLHLERGELAGEAWRYELASPRRADIAAIVRHPDAQDTHRIERESATLSPDAGHGTLRVWWAGPFTGARGGLQFRVLFGLVSLFTLWSAWLSRTPVVRTPAPSSAASVEPPRRPTPDTDA